MRKISKLCIVCDQEPPIKDSHVIPKFVFRWMIATGGTKYLRHGASVNKRVQDGIVYPLLCSKCETKASVFEKNFSELVFKPSVDQSLIPKKTGVSEYLFLASVHQRIQAYLKAEGKYQELEQDQKALVDQGIETLGDLLLEKRHSAYPFKIFLFSFGLGDYSHAHQMPPNWNRYIRRHTELDLIISDKNSIFGSYFKIGPWVSFCLLKNEGQPWMGGEVIQTSCKYMNRKAILPPNIMDFLKERAENSKKLLDSISQKQKANIEKAIIEGDLLTNGRPMYEAIMADVEIFGTLAFADK